MMVSRCIHQVVSSKMVAFGESRSSGKNIGLGSSTPTSKQLLCLPLVVFMAGFVSGRGAGLTDSTCHQRGVQQKCTHPSDSSTKAHSDLEATLIRVHPHH
ncbi:unnamed protein product [Eretmochelys imbricata]